MRTLVLLMLSISTVIWAGDSMIDRRLRDAITAMASNQVPGTPASLERGARLLVADGAFESGVEAVAKAFGDVFTVVGTPQAVEEVGVRLYGSRSEVAYFVVPCQRGAAFIRIVSVKRGDNQRIVSSVAVAAQPESVFPSALLEPESQQRR